MRVLLVEDDEAITMGLSYSLEKEGYEVVTAKNVAEARSDWTAENTTSAFWTSIFRTAAAMTSAVTSNNRKMCL